MSTGNWPVNIGPYIYVYIYICVQASKIAILPGQPDRPHCCSLPADLEENVNKRINFDSSVSSRTRTYAKKLDIADFYHINPTRSLYFFFCEHSAY